MSSVNGILHLAIVLFPASVLRILQSRTLLLSLTNQQPPRPPRYRPPPHRIPHHRLRPRSLHLRGPQIPLPPHPAHEANNQLPPLQPPRQHRPAKLPLALLLRLDHRINLHLLARPLQRSHRRLRHDPSQRTRFRKPKGQSHGHSCAAQRRRCCGCVL